MLHTGYLPDCHVDIHVAFCLKLAYKRKPLQFTGTPEPAPCPSSGNEWCR